MREKKKKRQRNNLIRVNSRSYFISATFLEHNSPICEKYRQCKWLQAVILQYFGFCLYKTIAAQGNEIYHKSVYANKSLKMDIRVPKQKKVLKCVCVLNLSDTYMLCKQTTRFAALIFFFFLWQHYLHFFLSSFQVLRKVNLIIQIFLLFPSELLWFFLAPVHQTCQML